MLCIRQEPPVASPKTHQGQSEAKVFKVLSRFSFYLSLEISSCVYFSSHRLHRYLLVIIIPYRSYLICRVTYRGLYAPCTACAQYTVEFGSSVTYLLGSITVSCLVLNDLASRFPISVSIPSLYVNHFRSRIVYLLFRNADPLSWYASPWCQCLSSIYYLL